MTNFALIVILMALALCSAIEISSKIDLDSTEECSNSQPNNPDPVVVVIKTETAEDHEETVNSQSSQGSGSRVGGNVNFNGPAKRIRPQHNYRPPPNQSKMIKNIYIIINGKGVESSVPGTVNCKENVCETTITTDTNTEDNSINSVSVSVFTKPKTIEVEDVPIIDGMRASGYGNDVNLSPPTFDYNNRRTFPYPNFFDNSIPQRPIPRRNPHRTQSVPFYTRNFGPRRSSTPRSPWIPILKPVDDKIELPFSKTDRVQ